jgi:hypothetical protein
MLIQGENSAGSKGKKKTDETLQGFEEAEQCTQVTP